jgi:chromate transporter
VGLLGWSVAGPLGMLATLAGIMLPSSLITFVVGRLRQAKRDALAVQAFSVGLAPADDRPAVGHRLGAGAAAGDAPGVDAAGAGDHRVHARDTAQPAVDDRAGAVVGAFGGA